MECASALAKTGVLITLAAAPLLQACSDENTVATVTCGTLADPGFEVRTYDSIDGPATNAVITSQPMLPGTIFRLNSPIHDRVELDDSTRAHSLRVSELDLSPARQDSAFWTLIRAPLQLRLDGLLDKVTAVDSASLISRVTRNTTVVISGSQRVALRDPLSLLNNDERAREIIRSEEGRSRFAIVWGMLYGDRIDLVGLNYSEYPELAVNTLSLPRVYLHYRFSCAPVDEINAATQSSGKSRAIAFLYRPVRASADGRIEWADPADH